MLCYCGSILFCMKRNERKPRMHQWRLILSQIHKPFPYHSDVIYEYSLAHSSLFIFFLDIFFTNASIGMHEAMAATYPCTHFQHQSNSHLATWFSPAVSNMQWHHSLLLINSVCANSMCDNPICVHPINCVYNSMHSLCSGPIIIKPAN